MVNLQVGREFLEDATIKTLTSLSLIRLSRDQ